MKREQQIKASKEMILNGLLKLIKEKPIDSITMTEVSEVADITRMTLYRHFKTKEDILLYAFDKNLDKFTEEIKGKLQPTIYDIMLFRFRVLKESPYSAILVENNYMKKLFEVVRKKTLDMNKFEMSRRFIHDELTFNFIGGGIDAVTEKWIRDGMSPSYEEMAEKVCRLIMKIGI
ncbi:TetR/AcrR family transcriptional regulator [Clostridium grantii]|uniref:Transcriptional regulator, TetR family n=1 Tax=Clostridium grantii DSM 8605 TaxID=1121316 RepID=A0A1M5XV18_9CLOT|nr:TetR/AcrR family transcriptional regulator [Clostridium grantii]SHI03569.1 transcriptional regulator, TetR family [Clostridium grantii DSM 8605]